MKESEALPVVCFGLTEEGVPIRQASVGELARRRGVGDGADEPG